MADINKTISVNYTSDVSQLLTNLKKIPGMTDKEAKKMVQALSKQLRQTEKAAKKAANTNVKSMKRVEQQVKRTTKSYSNLKRGASQMGRGLSELSMIAGDSDTEFGRMANTLGMAAISGAALIPLLGGMKTGLMALGATAGVATGGIGLLVAGLGSWVYSLHTSSVEVKEQRERIKKLKEEYEKLETNVKTMIVRNDQFKASLIASKIAIDAVVSSTKLQSAEIEVMQGKRTKASYYALKTQTEQANKERELLAVFDERRKTLGKNLAQETELAELSKVRLRAQAELIRTQGGTADKTYLEGIIKIAAGHSSAEKAAKAYFASINKWGTSTRAKSITQNKEVMKSLEDYIQAENRKRHAGIKLAKFTNASNEAERKQIIATSQANIKATNDFQLAAELKADAAEKAADRAASSSKSGSKNNQKELEEEQRLLAIANQKNQLARIEESLAMDKASAIDKVNQAIDKQILELQTLEEENLNLVNSEEELLNIKGAVEALEERRKKQIDEIIAKEQQKAEAVQKSLQMEQAVLKVIQDSIADRTIKMQDLHELEREFRNSKLEGEKFLHAEIMKMITAEEQKRLGALKQGFSDVEKFAGARLQVLQNNQDSEESAIKKMFYLQQSAAGANVLLSTAEAVAAALKYPAPFNAIMAATATAAGGAQFAAVMSTPPPTRHMGGIATDERNYTLLSGEGVISRAGMENIGGEQGLRRIEQGQNRTPEVIVISPFKHFDRYISNRGRRRTKKAANGGF